MKTKKPTKSKQQPAPKKFGYINLQVYPYWLVVSFEQTDQEFLTDFKKEWPDIDLKDGWQLTKAGKAFIQPSSSIVIIRCKGFPTTPVLKAILAHEIFHAVDFVLTEVGMELCNESCEAYAYLTQFITQLLYDGLEQS